MEEMPQPEQPKHTLFGNKIRWAIATVRAFRDELKQQKSSPDDLRFRGEQIKEGRKRFQPELIDRTHVEKYDDLAQTSVDKDEEYEGDAT